jgi:hypothetical protein
MLIGYTCANTISFNPYSDSMKYSKSQYYEKEKQYMAMDKNDKNLL